MNARHRRPLLSAAACAVRAATTRVAVVVAVALAVALAAAPARGAVAALEASQARPATLPADAARRTPSPRGGAVASAAPAATAAGLAILHHGGNAIDAAVATALALAVAHPIAGNLGGGGFAVLRHDGAVHALDFRETAPAAATPTMYLDAAGAPRAEASLVGGLAVGVPGTPRGLAELHRRFGRLRWSEVVAPALALAAGGFEVTPRLHAELLAERALLERSPAAFTTWFPGGAPPPAGSRVALPRLAAALRAYSADPEALSRGPHAAAIVAAVRAAGGVLVEQDLADYRPLWREPLVFSAYGWKVASMPLPSSGGTILGQTLGITARLGIDTRTSEVERAHLLIETWRRSYADRIRLGDPTTSEATPAQLLEPAWLDRRAAEIDRQHPATSDAVVAWPGPAAPAAATTPPPSAADEKLETTHLSVVDADGNAVALTTTLNGAFGSGVFVPELGYLLNNEMDDFSTAPGRPNLYGLVQGPANAVGPGKRMLSSITPTIAWRPEGAVAAVGSPAAPTTGERVLALGSPGGSRIPSATAQVLLRVLLDDAPLAAAVAAPRIHHQWRPDEVLVEREPDEDARLGPLAARGHRLKRVARIGEVHAVGRRGDGRLEAAADPRGPGAAAVWTDPAQPSQ